MGIDPSKPEGVHSGSARGGKAMDPRAGLRIDIERGAIEPELRVRMLAMKRWRQDAVVQRQRGFDDSRDASGRNEVADHGFDRAQRTGWRVPIAQAEDAGQSFCFRLVADR